MGNYAGIECALIPDLHRKAGRCDLCARPLPPYHRRWCSENCSNEFWAVFQRHHDWKPARGAAIRRDGFKCVRCGESDYDLLEVNHIVPREGKGYGRGCHHHQDNLETLCRKCHVIETTKQRRSRSQAAERLRTINLFELRANENA
jgi:5-methylcytosine-specific restriction endonuclease McrA